MDAEHTQQTTWFFVGCDYREGDRCQVFVGGSLVGEFGPGDVGLRNVLIVGLAADRRAHLDDLANAFQIGAETLRQQRKDAPQDNLRISRSGAEYSPSPARGVLNRLFSAASLRASLLRTVLENSVVRIVVTHDIARGDFVRGLDFVSFLKGISSLANGSFQTVYGRD